MRKTKIILPDGRVVSSGTEQQLSICSAKLTQSVNSREELTLGSVCAAMMEVVFWDPEGELGLCAGQQIQVMKGEENLGFFITEKPEYTSQNCVRLTAYDPVSRLDKDLSDWLASLTGWPYGLLDFGKMVCSACGVELTNLSVPNGDFPVQAFSASGITGRQLMQWVAEIAGRFCIATPEGALELCWYTPRETVLTPDGEHYYMGGIFLADYQVAKIEKVHLKLTDTDVGTVWPSDGKQGNTYEISGNYLLTSDSYENLQAAAQTLYEQLKEVSYTPCRVTVPAHTARVGDVLQLVDSRGKQHCVYVMSKVQQGHTERLECTGSPHRATATAVNTAQYAALSGKVLQLQMNVEGLQLENKDAAGKMAGLQMNVEGITTTVSSQLAATESLQKSLTQVRQTTEEVAFSVQTLQENGAQRVQTQTGYTFDENGLKIRKSGAEMENRLDNTGMYVERNGQTVLQANNQGVAAADITVRNYLIVGENSRFEDYGGRTGCFWIGG